MSAACALTMIVAWWGLDGAYLSRAMSFAFVKGATLSRGWSGGGGAAAATPYLSLEKSYFVFLLLGG